MPQTLQAMKPIKTPGLFDPGNTGQTFDQWQASAKPGQAMPSIAPAQVNDSVVSHLNKITSQDSPLMQAARTEGLKVANSRGLLNSSMAAGATQDAMLRYAVPLASQDASQANAQNRDARAFEYGMFGMDRDLAFRRGVQEREIEYQTGERALDRSLQERLASWNLDANERNAAAQMLYNMETLYQNAFNAVMSNTNLDASTRTTQLASARNLRDKQIDFVQQMFDIKLNW